MGRSFAILGMCACLLGGCMNVASLGANQIAKSTKANAEVELAHWAYWDDNCEGEAFDVAILTPPKNGRTEIRDSVYAIPSKTSSGALTGCVDKIVESKQVFYIPNEGFKGEDTAMVEFSGSSGVVTNAYSIRVR